MYAKHFGLAQDPFSIAPDPRYLFMSERHREALAHLLYGVGGGGGFVLLSGEIGTGKTTVCRCFLEQIPANCNVAYIFNPKLTVEELLRTVCDEFHVEVPAGAATAKDFIDPLNAFLLRSHAAGRNNVLIIDEAQNLSPDVLEQLRLLTNLETSERKLLQIVLIGQPELRKMLAAPELEQLAQRVIARFHLEALSEDETRQYVAHRLSMAGHAGALPFDTKALRRLHQLTRGVPRRINLLCSRALLGAYAHGQAVVDRKTLDKAAAEVFDNSLPAAPQARRFAPAALAGGAALLVAGGAALGWLFGRDTTVVATSGARVAQAPGLAVAPPMRPAATAAPTPASSSVSAPTTAAGSTLAAATVPAAAAPAPLASAPRARPIRRKPAHPASAPAAQASAPASSSSASSPSPLASATPLPARSAASGPVLQGSEPRAVLP